MTVTFYNILNVHIQHTNNVRELLGAACAELEAMMFRTVSQAFVRRQQAPYGRYALANAPGIEIYRHKNASAGDHSVWTLIACSLRSCCTVRKERLLKLTAAASDTKAHQTACHDPSEALVLRRCVRCTPVSYTHLTLPTTPYV